jgi:prepilin-type N-terminal cleavage/methylation domain-containing protein
MMCFRQLARSPRARRVQHAPRPRRAFTLIETSLALVIIGVGVLALVEAQQSFIKSNGWSTHAATATYLANEIRERTRRLPKHDPVTGLYFANNGSGGGAALNGWGPEQGEVGVDDYDDLDDFDGLTLAFNGTPGRDDGDLPGPIDAFGAVIPEINANGAAMQDQDGRPMNLQGWAQRIEVRKVDPTNFNTVYDNDEVLPADGSGFRGLAVDQFPLRVTVTVTYQGPFDTEPNIAAVVTWIVP